MNSVSVTNTANRLLIVLLGFVVPGMASASPMPANMVYLRTIDPSIEQDIPVSYTHLTLPTSDLV